VQDVISQKQRATELERRWAVYRCEQYDHRNFTWEGAQLSVADEFQFESGMMGSIEHTKGAPPKLSQRRPSVPINVCRAIVLRFSQLLFAGRTHPTITHPDKDMAQFLELFVKRTKFWNHMRLVRQFGGAQGTAISTFSVRDGTLVFEALDPRYCTIQWRCRETWDVAAVEIRYRFDRVDIVDKKEVIRTYWFVRRITDDDDITFHPVLSKNEDEPPAPRELRINEEASYVHGWGECPVVISQNVETAGSIDGDHDFYGVERISIAIDEMLSQAARGVKYNADPTVAVEGLDNQTVRTVTTGSGYILPVPLGGSASLMELSGGGSAAALEMVAALKKLLCEISQCVLDDANIGDRATATEVLRSESPMRGRADQLREQYSDYHIVPLIEKVLRCLEHTLTKPLRELNGRVKTDKDGRPLIGKLVGRHKELTYAVRKLSNEIVSLEPDTIQVNWPPYGDPILDEVQKAVASVDIALKAGIMTRPAAVKFTSPYFRISNPEELTAEVEQLPEPITDREVEDKKLAAKKAAPVAARGSVP